MLLLLMQIQVMVSSNVDLVSDVDDVVLNTLTDYGTLINRTMYLGVLEN